jgi:hypothetical protein
VEEASCLIENQKKVIHYADHLKYFTSKPGKCIVLDYEFKVRPFNQVVRNARSMPVSLRSAVRKQIGQCYTCMMELSKCQTQAT